MSDVIASLILLKKYWYKHTHTHRIWFLHFLLLTWKNFITPAVSKHYLLCFARIICTFLLLNVMLAAQLVAIKSKFMSLQYFNFNLSNFYTHIHNNNKIHIGVYQQLHITTLWFVLLLLFLLSSLFLPLLCGFRKATCLC